MDQPRPTRLLVTKFRQKNARRIEQMKLRKEAEAKLKGEDTEVVGYAEKAVDATTLPAGWAAAVDGDGDTYYVRSQLCHSCPTAHYMLLLTARARPCRILLRSGTRRRALPNGKSLRT